MHSYIEFPETYHEIMNIDLQKDKKMAFVVNGFGVLILLYIQDCKHDPPHYNRRKRAAGDLFVSWKFSKLPQDIIIKDVGVSMCIYSKENNDIS